MPAPLEFFFDFSSPYGYIAAMRIDEVAARHGRGVVWRPYLFGATFRLTGGQPLTTYPMKGQYSIMDFQRSAREHGIPFAMPASFPLATQKPARAFYWLDDRDPALAHRFAKAVYGAYFVDGRDISADDILSDIASGLGIDGPALLAAAADPVWKEKLRAVTEDAITRRGVFGSPFTFVDGEPFWGADRLEMIDRWLSRGGW